MTNSVPCQVSIISFRNLVPTIRCSFRHRRRFIRHSVATQVLHPSLRFDPNISGLFCRLRRHECRGTGAA